MSTVLDILTTGGILALVVIGLWFILGLLDIVNLATTGFMAVGAYLMIAMHSYWLGLLTALAISGVIGFIVEIGVVRRLYRRPLDSIIATWGVALVLTQAIALIWGTNEQNIPDPFGGATWLGYPAYRLVLLAVAVVVFAIAGAMLRLTRMGLIIRMVMQNEPLAAGTGINTTQVRSLTFVAGAALAGVMGAIIAPTQSVDPSYGQVFLVTAFLAVLMSGRSLIGLILACLLISIITTLFSTYAPNPVYGTSVVIIVGALALRFFPGGFAWSRPR